MSIARVLIIAGSDSGGGAGIQADLKAVAALGAHSTTVVTALTAQNTLGVHGVHPVPLDFVQAQYRAVADDIGMDAIKTGMLHSAALVELAARLIAEAKVPAVVDPVMVAKGGDRLLAADAVAAVREHLIPQAALLTPNLDEAEELLGYPVRDRAAMSKAARDLAAMGADAVLVKGGHLEGTPYDYFFDGKLGSFFSDPRIDTPHTHGTGCTLASAIAALLAQGWDMRSAVWRARLLVRRAIAGALPLGSGHGPVHAMADLAPRIRIAPAMDELRSAVNALKAIPGLDHLVSQSGCQIAYALPNAADASEVLGVKGGMTFTDGRLRAKGPVELGASRQLAAEVTAALANDGKMRAAIRLDFDDATIRAGYGQGEVGYFWRVGNPPRELDYYDAILKWGKHKVIGEAGGVPELIIDQKGQGQAPSIVLLDHSPADIVDRVIRLANAADDYRQLAKEIEGK